MNVIVDYGLGNINSLMNWFKRGNMDVVLSKDPKVIEDADFLILPGVGAFKYGMKKVEPFKNILENHISKKKPLLGICLGMQLLFNKSYEDGETEGLGFLQGEIKPFSSKLLKIPHMGWQELKSKEKSLYRDQYVYFVHSYYLETKDDIVHAWCDYGVRVPGVIKKDNILAFQFHPEKSGDFGEKILEFIKEFKDDYLPCN